MKRFVQSTDRAQVTLFPEQLEDYVGENNLVRVVDVFVEQLDLGTLGFDGVTPMKTGRPAYHPAVLLKLYIYGYLNRITGNEWNISFHYLSQRKFSRLSFASKEQAQR